MTSEDRIAKLQGTSQPVRHWLEKQVEEIEHFLDTLAYRNGPPEFRRAILDERRALIEAWRAAPVKENTK